MRRSCAGAGVARRGSRLPARNRRASPLAGVRSEPPPGAAGWGQRNRRERRWCPHRDSNTDHSFRKRTLYPLELWGPCLAGENGRWRQGQCPMPPSGHGNRTSRYVVAKSRYRFHMFAVSYSVICASDSSCSATQGWGTRALRSAVASGKAEASGVLALRRCAFVLRSYAGVHDVVDRVRGSAITDGCAGRACTVSATRQGRLARLGRWTRWGGAWRLALGGWRGGGGESTCWPPPVSPTRSSRWARAMPARARIPRALALGRPVRWPGRSRKVCRPTFLFRRTRRR
jgi:hypothetical protein